MASNNSRSDSELRSKSKLDNFFKKFVCDHLAKHQEVRQLVTCKLKWNHCSIRFNDVDKITSFYCDCKEKEGKTLNRDWKYRKDNLTKIMKHFENEGLLENVGSGKEYGKEYLKYEVKSDEMWHLLTKNYSVQRKTDMTNIGKIPAVISSTTSGQSSNTGDVSQLSDDTCNLETNSGTIAGGFSNTSDQFFNTEAAFQLFHGTCNLENMTLGESTEPNVEQLDKYLNNTGDDHPYEKILQENPPTSKNLVYQHPPRESTASETERILLLTALTIVPDNCYIKGGCSFVITADQILPRGTYSVKFGSYGVCKASRSDNNYLRGENKIPSATRRGTHPVEVQVTDETGIIIGNINFEYVDDIASKYAEMLSVEENSRSSVGSYPHNELHGTTKKSSSDELSYTDSKRFRSCAIDMPLLMYLCDEMAKRGVAHFFSALTKLGIMSAVLENRGEDFKDFAVTAQENGHIKLANTIKTSSRVLPCDSHIEALTFGKLYDAVQKEISLSKSDSVDSSDSDDNSRGYYGDSDSEDSKESMIKPEEFVIKPKESVIKPGESMIELEESLRRCSISSYEEIGQPHLLNTLTNEETNADDFIEAMKSLDADVSYHEDRLLEHQDVISSKNASEKEHVLPSIKLSSNDRNVLFGVTNALPEVCLCSVCQHNSGIKVQFKLCFDVRSSVKRRSKSMSDFSFIKKQSAFYKKRHEELTGSLRNINDIVNCWAKSTVPVAKAQSAITILDGEVNLNDGEVSQDYDCEKSKSTLIMQETLLENIESQVDKEFEEVVEFSLSVLEEQEVFARGKFGPLYKVFRGGREQLVKIVKTHTESEQHFVEEAREFLKCRHPFIRPTADILRHRERYFVMYWFLDGHSLFQAIEDNVIKDYVVYCRILFGMVKGLVYLEKMGIECLYLTPKKVLLSCGFNPRIAGVGNWYYKSQQDTETNYMKEPGYEVALPYLDMNLRWKHEKHSKNILWSVGRCIWDMLLMRICQKPGQEDLLIKYRFFAHLGDSCDNNTIRTFYFSEKLRKNVFEAGWPREKEITKSLVVCAVRCMLMNLKERISLVDLHNTLETELYELQKNVKFFLYENSDNFCLYCIKNVRDKLSLTCGCITACNDCLRNIVPLDCPEHGMQYSRIGHPLTYGVIIQGEFHESKPICDNDSVAMGNLLNDQNIFAIKNIERIKSKSQIEACQELKRLKTKIMCDKKAKDSKKYETTLLLFITGHCNDAGNLILPGGSILKKKFLCEFVSNINPKNLIVLVNGHCSEKLVKNLSKAQKNNFFTSSKFFGVFSHVGNMCGIAHKDISEENSIFVRFVLDILQRNVAAEVSPSSSSGASKGYLTIAELTAEISKRMQERFNACLKPIDRYGGCIPIAYI